MPLRVKKEPDDSEPDDSESDDSEPDDSEPKPFSLPFVTWNYGPGISGPFKDIRDTIVPLMFRQFEAFICHQEVKVNDKAARKKFLDGEPEEDYFYKSRLENLKKGSSTRQAISFPYELEDYEIECERVRSDKVTVGRYCSQLITVTRKDHGVSFVLVSFHAKYIGFSENERNDQLIVFFKKMHAIANEEEVPVIVGGDFNLDVDVWRYTIIDKVMDHVIVAPVYEAPPHRKQYSRIIDTFLVVHPKIIRNNVNLRKPIPICPIPIEGYIGGNETKLVKFYSKRRGKHSCKVLHYSKEDHSELEDIIEEIYYGDQLVLKKLLDHDPVMITIDITPRKHHECFYAVDSDWQQKACKRLDIVFIRQAIKDGYRGGMSTHLRCPDFRSIKRFGDYENSLFCAFSYVITGSDDYHMEVRNEIVEHMNHIEHHLFGVYINEDKYKNIKHYIAKTKMKRSLTPGTEAEIYTLAHLLKTNIYVYFYEGRWDRSNGIWHKYGPKFVTSDMSIYITCTDHYEVVKKQRQQ